VIRRTMVQYLGKVRGVASRIFAIGLIDRVRDEDSHFAWVGSWAMETHEPRTWTLL